MAATTDLVCFCDCDGSLDPRQLPLLTAPLLAGQADLVLGRRAAAQRDAWPLPARLANWELARRCAAARDLASVTWDRCERLAGTRCSA